MLFSRPLLPRPVCSYPARPPCGLLRRPAHRAVCSEAPHACRAATYSGARPTRRRSPRLRASAAGERRRRPREGGEDDEEEERCCGYLRLHCLAALVSALAVTSSGDGDEERRCSSSDLWRPDLHESGGAGAVVMLVRW